jgi:hypothetical protein
MAQSGNPTSTSEGSEHQLSGNEVWTLEGVDYDVGGTSLIVDPSD